MARTAHVSPFEDLIDHVVDAHETAVVHGHVHRAILVPEEDWLGLLATVELQRIPGLVQSIQEAATETNEEMTRLEDIVW